MFSRRVFDAPALLFVALLARTAGSAPVVNVEYRVPETEGAGDACPSRAHFIEALHARGVALDSPEAAARAHGVDVSIRYAGGAYVGELRVRSRGAEAASRIVHDANCSEVVSGLALTAAIALGGNADGPGAEISAPSATEALFGSDVRAPVPEPPSIERAGAPETAGAPRDERDPSGDTPRLRGSSFERDDSLSVEAGTLQLAGARSYSLTAGVHSGLIPGVILPRYDLNASLASFLSLPEDGGTRLFGPLLQVHWAVLGPVTSRHPGGISLDAWGLEAGLNSCSAATYDTQGWIALVCAEFGAGWLFMNAKPSGAAEGRGQTAGYGFAGLAFDAQYNFGPWAHLALRVGGRFNTPLRAEDPEGARLFDGSPWGAYGSAGFGLHF